MVNCKLIVSNILFVSNFNCKLHIKKKLKKKLKNKDVLLYGVS